MGYSLLKLFGRVQDSNTEVPKESLENQTDTRARGSPKTIGKRSLCNEPAGLKAIFELEHLIIYLTENEIAFSGRRWKAILMV